MKSQSGFTLVELMIGITVGFIILLAAGSVLSSTIISASTDIKEQRLNQMIYKLTSNMVTEIRRAGSTIPNVTLTKQASDDYYNAQADCITFSRYSIVDGGEIFLGYRLSNNVIYYYESTASNASCSDLSGWVAVTEPTQVKIDTLTFTKRAGSTALIDVNIIAEAVGLTVNGQPVKRDITVTSRVRNG